jgi:hypothetical protein
MLGLKPRALCVLGKNYSIKLHRPKVESQGCWTPATGNFPIQLCCPLKPKDPDLAFYVI